jgi:putative ABC transport system permease protein
VVIATLGLLGIVIHTIETKRKEITIRKIIGADRKQLIKILSSGFIRLLFIAGLIAMPVGYILGYMFLFNFAERVTLGVFNVVFCFLFLLAAGSGGWTACRISLIKMEKSPGTRTTNHT